MIAKLKYTVFLILGLLFISILSSLNIKESELEESFKNPPESARAHTWWHWVDGNISKEGITKDLESFKTIGLSGFQLFDVGLKLPHGGTVFNSKEYHDKLSYTISEAQRLGLEMGINCTSGWSSTGGPWIEPENSMKMLVWSEQELNAKTSLPFQLNLPELTEQQKKYDFYKDIAVIAFPKTKNSEYRIANWEAKSLNDLNTKADKFVPSVEKAPLDAIIKLDDVLILTDKMDASGKLNWTPPSNDWTILRIGYTTTGAHTKPASKGGMGLEIDKLSKTAVNVHWNALLDKIIADTNGKKAFTTILIDSYEVGGQNWTDGFETTFKNKVGYDILPRLLCATGRVLESTEYSERVLWDIRKLVADEMFKNYYMFFKEKCHQHGLQLATEPYGSGSFDAAQVAKITDLPMTEFWHKEKPWKQRDLWQWTSLIVPSAAHLSGKSIVGAEAFTRIAGDWTAHPYNMKVVGDNAFTMGVNRYYFHTSAHQPWSDNIKPGMTMGRFGTNIHRNNTWYYQSTEWLNYIARCQLIMQTGTFQADVLMMYGDERGFNNFIDGKERLDINLIDGYKFDLAGIDSLNGLDVDENGTITVSYEGKKISTTYKILHLKRDLLMRLESIKKLGELAEKGAIIIAQKPIRTPGLETDTKAKAVFNQLIVKYWDSGLIKQPESYMKSIKKLTPDCQLPKDMAYSHHRIGTSDFYFVSNQSYDAKNANCIFRVSGMQPELWNAETGKITNSPNWKQLDNGTTSVDLDLTPAESIFVVFRNKTKEKGGSSLVLKYKDVQTIDGDWNLTFDKNFGPKETITLKNLIPWNTHTNEEVKYYSGTATYKTSFTYKPTKGNSPIQLDLGTVEVIAKVKLNGKDLGVLWKPPFQTDITDVVKKGVNELEIEVTNLWPNRLIGDAQYPNFKNAAGKTYTSFPEWTTNGEGIPKSSKRKTFSAYNHYDAKATLLTSGLIGPVKIIKKTD